MDHGKKERIRQADTLMKIISPVLTHGADGTLFSAMPKGDAGKWARANKDKYAALEAVGRTLRKLNQKSRLKRLFSVFFEYGFQSLYV